MNKYLVINSAYESHSFGIITAENEYEAKIKFVTNNIGSFGNNECYEFFYDDNTEYSEDVKRYIEGKYTSNYTKVYNITNIDNAILLYDSNVRDDVLKEI